MLLNTKEKETSVKCNPGLSTNRPSKQLGPGLPVIVSPQLLHFKRQKDGTQRVCLKDIGILLRIILFCLDISFVMLAPLLFNRSTSCG